MTLILRKIIQILPGRKVFVANVDIVAGGSQTDCGTPGGELCAGFTSSCVNVRRGTSTWPLN